MSAEVQSWRKAFESRQQLFSTREIQRAVEYLVSARRRNEAWGTFPEVESNLHCSALAIEALSICPDHRTLGIVADAVAYLRREFGHQPETMSFSEIGDMLSVVYAETNPDEAYAQKLIGVLPKAYDEKVALRGEPAVRELSSVLLRVVKLKIAAPFFRSWVEHLLKAQNKDGSWGTGTNDTGSMASTAATLSVLTLLKEERVRNARNRGIQFLVQQLEKDGWEKIGAGGDTFTQATILRSLSECPEVRYKDIQAGIKALQKRVNLSDGGWGGGNGEPSNVECTSLCILALSASGENKFVPMRLSGEALSEIEHQLTDAIDERNQLRKDLEKQIEQRIGSVLRDRDNLREEVKKARIEFEAKNRTLEAEIEMARKALEAQRESFERWLRRRSYLYPSVRMSNYYIAFAFMLGGVVVLGALHYWEWPLTWSSGLMLAYCVFFPIVFFCFLWRRNSRLQRESSVEADTLLPSMRYEIDDKEGVEARFVYSQLRDILSELPPSLREELSYRMLRDLLELPPDVGGRYIEDLISRFDLPGIHRRRLVQLLEVFVRMRPSQRRLVWEQLRHVAMR
jgi:hypothetical protein